ncbi:MAG: AAA family ATPase [Methyloprofundus sp.]|nr:AAA family ATPase [Methyloprofundus sp.]
MLENFKFSNFYSFAEEAEISLLVNKKPSPSYFDIDLANGTRLNKVISIIGPNGSGKTQILRPIAFLSWFISHSFLNSEPTSPIPFKPHLLTSNQSSKFELEFYIQNEQYKYQLITTPTQVEYESLHKKTSHLYSYVFIRELKNGSYQYKHQGFEFPRKLAEKIRGNVSIISAANIHDSAYATKISNYFSTYTYNINISGRENYHQGELFKSAAFFKDNPILQNKASKLLCNLDLGLSGVELVEIEATDEQGKEKKLHLPFGHHASALGSFKLPFFDESSGTQSAYVLLRRILPVLEHGGVAILDEIDNDLHPHMLPAILELFKFEHTNPHNAQILFTCHTPEILNILKKHQLYLVEKNDLFSEAWRLDQVSGLRSDDNIYAKYQAGALNAVPNI